MPSRPHSIHDEYLLALGDPTDGGLHPTELPYETWLEQQVSLLQDARTTLTEESYSRWRLAERYREEKQRIEEQLEAEQKENERLRAVEVIYSDQETRADELAEQFDALREKAEKLRPYSHSAEMRWMSVEDSTIEVPARAVAEIVRLLNSNPATSPMNETHEHRWKLLLNGKDYACIVCGAIKGSSPASSPNDFLDGEEWDTAHSSDPAYVPSEHRYPEGDESSTPAKRPSDA